MRNIRRSPLTRAFAWLLTLAMVAPILALDCIGAQAQSTQVLRVIVADFINKGKYGGEQLGKEATDAVYNELVNSGQGRFYVFGNQEVLQEAKRIGLRTPSVAGAPAYFSRTDLLRLAKELQADAIVEGQVGTPKPTAGRAVPVSLGIKILDAASQEYINGGFARVTATPKPGQSADPEELITQGISDAALSVVREAVQRQQVSATVLQRVGDTIVLNKGLRDGIREGDELVVVRETAAGGRVKQGNIKIARAYATDSEAEVRKEVGAIRPEDIARVLYTTEIDINTQGTTQNVARSPRAINFSLIGSTLAVLGLGVLLAQGSRGGQGSVTDVSAEPFTQTDGTPSVHVKWRDNIFGQAGVVQYHIYRNPDFPYSPNVFGGGTSGTGTTTTNVISSFPVGLTDSLTRKFDDQPNPFSPYLNGQSLIYGQSAASANSTVNNNNNSTGSTTTTNGCSSIAYIATNTTNTIIFPLATGFTPGKSYTYAVTAIILRQLPTSGGSTSTSGGTGSGSGGLGSGGTGSGGTGSGSGSTTGSSTQCIETDPVTSGLATPLQPVIISTPASGDTVMIRQFNPTFLSTIGADLYQLEVSTDRTFKNTSRIFRYQFPGTDALTSTTLTLPAPIDLANATELLNDPDFKTYITSGGVTKPVTLNLYFRVGARRDEDSPGPVYFPAPDSNTGDRTFRFVYPATNSVAPASLFDFTAASGNGGNGVPNPPSVASRAARLLNSNNLTRVGGKGNLPLPLPGQSIRGRAARTGGSTTIQSLLTGRTSKN